MSFSERGNEFRQFIADKAGAAKERLGQAKKAMGEKIFDAYVERRLPILKSRFDEGGFAAVAQEQLRTLNARVEYALEGLPEFGETRKRLNSEPGLIISNHPYAGIDAPLILQTLSRDDVQIVVRPDYFPLLAKTFGEKYFVPAEKSLGGVKQTVRTIQGHIEEGGVTLLFPAGGGDAEGNVHFQKGFGAIVAGLPPDSMVYAFHVDVSPQEAAGRFPGEASDLWTGKAINSNYLEETLTVGVQERYTQARQWQGIASLAARRSYIENDFSEYYGNLFSKP